MVHRERKRMRQRGIVVQMERTRKGRVGKKKAFLVPSQLCFLMAVTYQEILKAMHKDLFFLTYFHFQLQPF